MITRDQVRLMLLMRQFNQDSLFHGLPDDLIKYISDIGKNENPKELNSSIAIALHHAAYAESHNIDTVVNMVNADPRLLLMAGDVITPGGPLVKRVTLYEFFLGDGNPDSAMKIAPYFSILKNGEAERTRQYNRYRHHIEGMLTQTPYDSKPLIEIIKHSPDADVTAALNKDMRHANPLRDALIKFRKDNAPRVLNKPCMHYNYATLLHALNTLDLELPNSYQTSFNHSKLDLVHQQLIGFLLRRLPGVDRCALASGYYSATSQDNDPQNKRSYQFRQYRIPPEVGNIENDDALMAALSEHRNRYNGQCEYFPVTINDVSLDGLGFDRVLVCPPRSLELKNYWEQTALALHNLRPSSSNQPVTTHRTRAMSF